MAWNGSGTFSRTNGTHTGSTTWVQDRDAGDEILATRHDTHDQDLADGINACLTKNNESKPTATFAPNSNASYDLGTSSLKWRYIYADGLTFNATGLGVGVSPSFKLHVQGAGATAAIFSGSDSGIASINLGRTAIEATIAICGAADQFFTGTAAGDAAMAYGTKLWIGTGDYDTPGAVAAVVNSSGEFLIGSTTDQGSYKLQVTGGAIFDSIALTAFSAAPVTMNTGYTNNTLEVTKDAFGHVWIKGNANKDSSGVGALTYFTLASGYRPDQTVKKCVLNETDGAIGCVINTNGTVVVTHTSSNSANTYFDMVFPTA